MLNINRTADYVVLWKSHKRAEWAAVGLDGQAAELRQRLERGVNLDLSPAASVAPPGPASNTAVAVLPPREVAAANPPVGTAAVIEAPAAAVELELLEAESRRMWKLHAELGVELSQVARLLTTAQRQSAEKVLQQWAETGGGS